jgi:hypothetical protein
VVSLRMIWYSSILTVMLLIKLGAELGLSILLLLVLLLLHHLLRIGLFDEFLFLILL